MSSIRGLVLMSRLEYLEKKYGAEEYREFLKKISTDEVNFLRQPLDVALIYPDSLLATIDQILLHDYLNENIDEFKNLGKWGADNFMYRFFSQYVDDAEPLNFLTQYGRLRDYLIGSGEMKIQSIDEKHLTLSIDYGQQISKSVCLSEQGFIEGGMAQCGAKDISIIETTCASESEDFICQFDVKFN